MKKPFLTISIILGAISLKAPYGCTCLQATTPQHIRFLTTKNSKF